MHSNDIIPAKGSLSPWEQFRVICRGPHVSCLFKKKKKKKLYNHHENCHKLPRSKTRKACIYETLKLDANLPALMEPVTSAFPWSSQIISAYACQCLKLSRFPLIRWLGVLQNNKWLFLSCISEFRNKEQRNELVRRTPKYQLYLWSRRKHLGSAATTTNPDNPSSLLICSLRKPTASLWGSFRL